ncbi:MAG: hypothetical protein GWN84_20780 [Gammaproteobacteria bacterium]|nr:hypothetical protein [Gammaproteobacteria bacterium]NIR85196.1 hypothetical protein [Gammaproteobacteria bacterium]NIU06246.1 hypothetical protein [Gammaproteobacteria bacterium]NIX87519.1 hypothetical protein [Gammaproteobacteria bacterium]
MGTTRHEQGWPVALMCGTRVTDDFDGSGYRWWIFPREAYDEELADQRDAALGAGPNGEPGSHELAEGLTGQRAHYGLPGQHFDHAPYVAAVERTQVLVRQHFGLDV